MISDDKIVCETPTPGKRPTRIHKWKYDIISKIILELLPFSDSEGLLFKDLAKLVAEKLVTETKEKIGSISWYTTTVKLDLECKEKIKRIPGSSPQRLVKPKQNT